MTTETTERPGFLVLVEGPDGVGKTTFCRNLEKDLTAFGVDVLVVREPYDRNVMYNANPIEAFAADRVRLWQNKIADAYRAGKVIISDRSVWSSVAYQGRGDGMESMRVLVANNDTGLLQAHAILHSNDDLVVIVLLPSIPLRDAPLDQNDADEALQADVRAAYEALVGPGIEVPGLDHPIKMPGPMRVFRDEHIPHAWGTARMETCAFVLAALKQPR